MRVVVVDDEEPARRRLIRMLGELSIEVVGEANNGLKALDVLNNTQPDLLFLDIRMPQMDGLALAARYADLPPVVFVTAYEEHAVDAFEVNAVDYLLKPVRRERLKKTLERAKVDAVPAEKSFDALPPIDADIPRIVVTDRNTTRLFDAREITRFWASNKYTVFSVDGEEHMTTEALSTLEERLATFGFIRVHRAELIRRDAVLTLTARNNAFEVGLSDGQSARVSRRLASMLKRELNV